VSRLKESRAPNGLTAAFHDDVNAPIAQRPMPARIVFELLLRAFYRRLGSATGSRSRLQVNMDALTSQTT
jgi:hypothetical protein